MDITGAILLTGIGLVVGFLVAALIFSLRKESTPTQKPKQQLLSDAENKVRIWREGGEQRLVVEMNGVSYNQENKLRPEKKRILESLLSELQIWLGVTSAAAAAVASQPIKSLSVNEQPVDAQEGPNRNPLKIFGGVLQPQKKSDADELDLSIVAQIDQILQAKLEETHLDGKGIQLVEGPDQGMLIEIGLDKYIEIESVPDEEIRQLIRASVADWESSLGD